MMRLTPARFSRLMTSDAKSVGRDPTLLFAIVMSALPPFMFWLWAPGWEEAALASFGVESLSRYLAPVFLVMPAMLLGWVTGCLLLEDRDDGTLLAVDVTPLGKAGFFTYRALVTAAVTAVVTAPSCAVVISEQPATLWVALTLLISIEAVCAAFVLPALARNKVEGLAITKLTNLFAVAPLLALIDSPLRYLAGLIPTFWIGEALSLSDVRYLDPALIITFGVAYHLAAAALLYKLVGRRVG